ncbi:MAG: hypothetical protein NT011_02265 [Kiritimatiellaeota bacterium]|nr:hypothetical protein [Kiritimatiellota bacterium]
MICLTGDVHHDGLRTNEQLFLAPRKISEVAITLDYVRLCGKYDVKCTLYVTGRTLADQWEAFQPVTASPLVEIGGHTYAGLPQGAWVKLLSRLSGEKACSHSSSPGTCSSQKRDVARMLEIAHRRLDKPIVSWRSHGLVRDRHTYGILAGAGIKFISDDLNWHQLLPERLPQGLISHPMNVIMDHDHLFHAHRNPEYVARQQRPFPDDPASGSYTIEDWGALVEKQVRAIEAKGGVATVLMHPLCMFAADGFKTMERLLKQFSKFKTIWASETENYLTPLSKEFNQNAEK